MVDPNITKLLKQILENQKQVSLTPQIPFISNHKSMPFYSEKPMTINPNPFSCDMVIARYKESLPWLSEYSKYKFRNVIIYNKNKADNNKTSKDIGCVLNSKECIKVNLPNVGRCDHTYLYHIIENYNNLADVTIFTKGSSDLFREVVKLRFTVGKVFEVQDTVISADTIPLPVHIYLRDFSLNTYRSSHPVNYDTDSNSDSFVMQPASIRPFGKWFEAKFPGLNIFKIVYAGIFGLSRKLIHQHPKSYYQNLIKELEGHSNPEVGHYFERSWMAIFHPIPESCIYESVAYSSHFGGRRTRRKRKHLKRKLRRKNSKKVKTSR